jgi:MFS family permease
VDILGLTLILPLLPFYAEHYGASPTQVGLLVATFAGCQLFSGPLLGRLSDRFGRKPLLLISQVGTLIGFLILARAETLWVIFLSRAIDGATAGNLTLAQAYISDVTLPKDRARSFAVIGIAFGMGFLLGPAISGYLSQFGYSHPVYLAAGLSFTSIIATAALLPAGRPRQEPETPADGPVAPGGRRLSIVSWGLYVDYFRRPELGKLLFQFFCFVFAFAWFMSGFALFAERRLTWDGAAFGAKEVGYLFAYSGFLGVILQGGLLGRMVKRFGEVPLLRSGFIAAAISYALLAVTHNIPMVLLAGAISAYGNGVLRPTLTSLVTQRAQRNEQGLVLGLTQSLLSVSQLVAPVFAGILIDHRFLAVWALIPAAFTAAGLAISRMGPSQMSLKEGIAPRNHVG